MQQPLFSLCGQLVWPALSSQSAIDAPQLLPCGQQPTSPFPVSSTVMQASVSPQQLFGRSISVQDLVPEGQDPQSRERRLYPGNRRKVCARSKCGANGASSREEVFAYSSAPSKCPSKISGSADDSPNSQYCRKNFSPSSLLIFRIPIGRCHCSCSCAWRSRLKCVWCSGRRSAGRRCPCAFAVEAAISASSVAGSARRSRMATAGRDQDGGRVAAVLL
jgi:hypothetical protein